ncbi:MAG: DNA packaging protein [Clostridia bacterium]|jgi:hypothetical protein|nr:DNA packaging protein [Clostridia bacterium]
MSINTKQYIEEYIKIRNKNGEIISLKFNSPQEKYYNIIKKIHSENKPIRIIILKARQMGFSTETEAIIFKNVVTKHHYNAGIVAHKKESTTNLFNMSKRMYEYLPDVIKPEQKKSNAKELVFNNSNGTGLDSKIKCMTAGGKGIGRSDTFTALHLSELAFWQGNKKDILTGLFQAVPSTSTDTMIIIESTANGFEYFKEMWDKAVAGENDFYPLFIGWNELEEYQMPYTGFELTEEEFELQKIYGVTLEQLTWRRWCIRNNCGDDIDTFKQEYPICPEEAFLSTGKCYFNKENIINRLRHIIQPITIGYFLCKYTGMRIKDIKYTEDKKGYIKIYKKPAKGRPYVIGGDTAGEGSDYFTLQVLDNITGEQVAVLKQEFDETEYVKQAYCLGIYYNNALIALENNFSTYPTKKLEELEYPNLYVREKEDTYTGKNEKSYGFKTTQITRPLILALLQEIVKDEIEKINDKETLIEMLSFIKNKNGRAEAEVGYHDDLILALSIAHYIRPQQKMSLEIENIEKIQKEIAVEFGLEKEKKEDSNSTIEVF